MSGQAFKDFLHSVRTAEKWDRLRAMLTPRDKLGVVIHGEPDPDSLASGWALMYLLKSRVASIRLFATQPVRREENVRFLNVLRIPLEVVQAIPVKELTKTAVVDAQPDFFQPALGFTFDIVIDHHPKQGRYSFKFSDIRPDYGSTATMLLEYLLWSGNVLPKNLATALWFGLRTDTDNLDRTVRTVDLAAYSYLYRRSNRRMIQWLEQSAIPSSYRDFFMKGLYAMDPHHKQAVIMLGEVPQPDACVHVADFLARFVNVRWVAVAGVHGTTLFIILRGGAFGINVGRIARLKLGAFGSAGGHHDKARAEILTTKLASLFGAHPTNERIEQWLRSVLVGGRRSKESRNNNHKRNGL